MASLREIRRKITSFKSTGRITKAMEMVAASKMRRAQSRVLSGRPYAEKIREMLANVAAAQPETDAEVSPLLAVRPVKRVGLILISADRGLAGGFNANMLRRAAQFLLESPVEVSVTTVGRKGRDFIIRSGRGLRAEFSNIGDFPSLLDTLPMSRVVIDDFRSGFVDEVYVGYSKFINTAVQRPVIERVLPIEPPENWIANKTEYIYEPDARNVLNELTPRYVEMQIFHAILESQASEQSARMVAMRNATENANEVVAELTLLANKVRQEVITRELLEIVGGAAALNG